MLGPSISHPVYVLSLYAKNNAAKRKAWRDYVRNEFRNRIRTMLQDNYKFYVMTPRSDTIASEFFKEHFRDVVGKVYDPYGVRGGFEYYSLALRQNTDSLNFDVENRDAKALLEKGFCIEEIHELGTKPEDVVVGQPRNPNVVMSTYNFERAVRELSNGAYEAHFGIEAIRKIKEAKAFPLAVGVTVKDHPENVHTIFLYNSGHDNKLCAVAQVVYVDQVNDTAALFAYVHEGMDCAGLRGVQIAAGPRSPLWIWQILNWVDV